MQTIAKIAYMIAVIFFLGSSPAYANTTGEQETKTVLTIVASDTILSGMIASLLPPNKYYVDAILPPGQCPGHYDVKLSDIEKTKKADLLVAFRGMSFIDKLVSDREGKILVDMENRNWMVPNSYIHGLTVLAYEIAKRFPEDSDEIMKRKKYSIRAVNQEADRLIEMIKQEGIYGKVVIASSMQKEPLEWMGFHVMGEYGRPEGMSLREFARLSRIGQNHKAIAVVDNLQSGPVVGKGIAETLGLPHVVLTNFPSEKGYLVTLRENVDSFVATVKGKKNRTIK